MSTTEHLDGEQLRRRREALHLTQGGLAREAGVSDETVRKAEKGRHIGPSSARGILEALARLEVGEAVGPVTVHDRLGGVSGRGVITVRAAAVGLEIETTYDGEADRTAVLGELLRALGVEGHEVARRAEGAPGADGE